MYKTQTTKKKQKTKTKTKNKENLMLKFLILLYNQSRPFYSHSDSLPSQSKMRYQILFQLVGNPRMVQTEVLYFGNSLARW